MPSRSTDASVAFSVTDNFSQSIVGMKNSVNSFKQDVVGLQKTLDALDSAKFQLKNFDLKRAKQELRDAQKEFNRLGDSAEDADKKLAAEQNLRDATEKYDNIRRQLAAVSRQAKETEKDLLNATIASSKAENRAGSSVLSALGQAGIFAMAGNVASQWADVIVGSSFGGEVGGLFSGALSGAASGASLGTLLGGPAGTAIGAAIGGALGLAGGAAQSYQSRDQAFMGYYGGLYETASQATESSLTAGTGTAAQRELDAIAFDKLLYGQGDEFLAGLRETAARTPFEYADLTAMGRNLATGFGSDPERMLELMTAIGDAGAAVGASTSDMQWMATALSRMQSTDLAQLGEINMFQDRGVDVIGMLAEAYGKNEGDIRSMISSGDIGGREAVSIIQAALSDSNGPYAGSMALMAETFDGLTSTLSDAMAEIDNAAGEGYNEKAKEGLQADIDAYGGELGDALATANEIIGEGKAIAENLDRQYSREALSALMLGTDTTVYGEEQAAALKEMHGQYTDLMERYQTASEEDKAIIAGEIEALKEKAQAMADAGYDASSMAQSLQDVELDLIASIRDLTDKIGSVAWGRDYEISQERGKGQMAVSDDGSSTSAVTSGYQVRAGNGIKGRYAYGLDRVPYDNYAALLHEGERVLTAREAREQDRSGTRPVQVNISGSWSVRTDEDVDAIATSILRKVELALRGGVR